MRCPLGTALLAALLFALPACAEDDNAGGNAADIPAEDLVESGCNSDDDCVGGTCIAGIGEGLCTADCQVQEDCPDGTISTDTENDGTDAGVCLLACTESSYCSDLLGPDYNCDTESSFTSGEDVRVCIDGA